jgi:hypothetical protein
MKQIVDRLKGHLAAGYQPMPRGAAPPDDTLEKVLAEIERLSQLVDALRAALAEHRPTVLRIDSGQAA